MANYMMRANALMAVVASQTQIWSARQILSVRRITVWQLNQTAAAGKDRSDRKEERIDFWLNRMNLN